MSRQRRTDVWYCGNEVDGDNEEDEVRLRQNFPRCLCLSPLLFSAPRFRGRNITLANLGQVRRSLMPKASLADDIKFHVKTTSTTRVGVYVAALPRPTSLQSWRCIILLSGNRCSPSFACHTHRGGPPTLSPIGSRDCPSEPRLCPH
jgi:hypothetical protein